MTATLTHRSSPITVANWGWMASLVLLMVTIVGYGEVKSNWMSQERIRTEEARAKAEENVEKLSAIISSLKNVTDTYYIVEHGGICEFITDGMCELLKRKRCECIGVNMHDLIHHHRGNGDDYPLEDCAIFNAMDTKVKEFGDNETLWDANGIAIPCSWISEPYEAAGKCHTRITIIPRGNLLLQHIQPSAMSLGYSK